jgi:hypothetical protein
MDASGESTRGEPFRIVPRVDGGHEFAAAAA